MRLLLLPAVLALVAGVALPAPKATSGRFLVYIGGYTGDNNKGIQVFRFDAGTGKLEPLGLAGETVNPSFLAIHPNRKFLYAVGELAAVDGKKGGAVSAFSIDSSTGKLTFLNRVSSGGAGPCHLNVDKTGRNVLVANYGGGSVAVLPLEANGRLKEASTFIQHTGSSVDPKRQQGPHAHSINLSADNRFAIVADLGLDQVFVYRFDADKGTLAPHDPPFVKVAPGAGPRHFAFHPNGRLAYVINELKSTLTVLRWDAARGTFQPGQTLSTLPAGFTGNNSTAEVQVHPSGRFVYGSNRGHDSIAVFAADKGGSSLKLVENAPALGRTPRNFAIDPTGQWIIAATQQSGNLAVLRIDAKTGKLNATGLVAQTPAPVCVKFLPLD